MRHFKNLLLAACLSFVSYSMTAQTALVQVIHNSADQALQMVDIYVDGNLWWDDLAFRTATPYLDVMADMETQWAIAPFTSVSAEEAILTLPHTLVADGHYVMAINGLVSTSGYSPILPLDLDMYASAATEAADPSNIDLLFAHGCTDLPGIKWVDASSNALLQSTFFFGQFGAAYTALNEENYLLEIQDASNNTVEQFVAPLADLGLTGTAVTAILSGFNNPANNFLGAELGLWLALPNGGDLIECPIYIPPQYTQAQLIHASADPLMAVVDIYMNDTLWIDDFAYLHATAFTDIQALVDVELLIAPSNSIGVEEAFASLVVNLSVDQDYVLTIQGNAQTVGFYPSSPLSVQPFAGAISNGLAGSSTNLLFINASTDMPALAVSESELLMIPLIEDFAFGTNAGYFEVFTADYAIALSDPGTGEVQAAYGLPLSIYPLGSNTATIIAAGYINGAANQNAAPYALYLSLAGGGALIPLPVVQAPAMTSVQFVHNSPDPLLNTVDVYLNEAKWIEDLPFRHASPFIQLPIGVVSEIAVVAGDATDLSNASTWSFEWQNGQQNQLVLNGLLEGENYNPNLPLTVISYADVLTSTNSDQTTIKVVNGGTDAPTFNIENTNDGSTLTADMSYNTAGAYWSLPALDVVIDLTNTAGDQVIASYGLPLASWALGGGAHTLVASGFFAPSNNNDGPAFGLWLTSPNGGAMMELPQEIVPIMQARAQFIHNAADINLQTVDLYMNGELIADNWNFRGATPFMEVPAEVPVLFAIAPATSDGPEDALVFHSHTFEANAVHYVIANGVLADEGYNPQQPFIMSVFDEAREASTNANQCDIIFYHGSSDTPGINVSEITLPMPGIVDNLMYDGLGGYLALDESGDYGLNVSTVAATALGQFALPVNANGMAGKSVFLFASGFLNPGNNSEGPSLSMYAAEADGTTYALPAFVGIEENTLVQSLSVSPNPAHTMIKMVLDLKEAQILDLELIDINGKIIISERNLLSGKSLTKNLDVSELPEGYYFLRIKNRQLVETIGFGIIR
jgi:hypothetical protein